MQSAVRNVLGTYELLERILLNLSTKCLFGTRRVSRRWNDVAQRSHELRKRMYLMPDGQPLKSGYSEYPAVVCATYNESVLLNPVPDFYYSPNDDKHGSITCFRNGWIGFGISKIATVVIAPAPFLHVDWFDEKAKNPAYLARDAACKDMFLTQPPITAITLNVAPDVGCTIYNPRGLTFRDVWESSDSIAQKYRQQMNDLCGGRPYHRYINPKISFSMALPLEEEVRKRAHDWCNCPEGEMRASCDGPDALFGPRS